MATDDPAKKKTDPEIDRLFARARELRAEGVDIVQAVGLADLENRLHRWPPAWGDDLHILVYGDFEPPPGDVSFPDLGIRLSAKKREGSVISDAMTVLDAHVSVPDKSIASVLDAVRRVNVFIGAWALTDWAHGYRGWWCYMISSRTNLTASDITELYQQVVNPGFVGKAQHALRVCFKDQADRYIRECFSRPQRRERLYDVRNAINHGDVDAEDPRELLRVQARFGRLWMIVWRMFACFIPFSAPVDRPEDWEPPVP